MIRTLSAAHRASLRRIVENSGTQSLDGYQAETAWRTLHRSCTARLVAAIPSWTSLSACFNLARIFRIQAGLDISEVLLEKNGHIRVEASAVRHGQIGAGARLRLLTISSLHCLG